MTIDASTVRRTLRRCVQAGAVAAALALACATGCESPPQPVEEREIATGALTEDQFTDHVAALTVAVEEGLTGEAARDRAAELGGGAYTRDEIEAFADLLRADPVKWAAIDERVGRRIAEIRSGIPGRTSQAGEEEPSVEAEGVRTGEVDRAP